MNLDCTVPLSPCEEGATYAWHLTLVVAAPTALVLPATVANHQFAVLAPGDPGRSSAGSSLEVVAALITAGAAWTAIGRMVDTREPSAGI